ncbi:glycoside hydrolase, family 22 [Kipferlia bialata]|uniref:Glycoside hydrolase, family 22 n=1 Tax=Kipferlia bialata TaxID=797122 RepID=A0A9K3DA44_9EUKA|nr:glycoside hydrolase, family 22 [Kipferlia bialata]|eukprot:g12715.t1
MKFLLVALAVLVVVQCKYMDKCAVYKLAQKYWDNELAATMTCIAFYESSWNTKAINHNTNGSTDFGLYQG